MTEYNELLEAWEDSVENFLLWLEIICGIEKGSNTYQTLKENVVNMNELFCWINFFSGNLDDVESTAVLYMKNKFVEI